MLPSSNIKVIINAEIWTGDKSSPFGEAIIIENDLIKKVGLQKDIMSHVSDPNAEIIDAKGAFITPGFIDSHIHLLMAGERLLSVQLKKVSSKQDFIATIGEHVKSLPKGTWVVGGDWDHENWGAELPTRFWIDSVTPDHPVWLSRHEGHTYLANTLALKLAGLIDESGKACPVPQMDGGSVEVDSEGQLTGIFKDNALQLVYPKIPLPSEEEFASFLKASSDEVIPSGITSIHHMVEPADRNRGGDPHDLEVYIRNDLAGKLKLRVYSAIPIQFWPDLVKKKDEINAKCKMLRCGALKVYSDGSIGSHSAAFFDDYCDTPGYSGSTVNSEEDLFKWISGADQHDLQIFVHGIGDKGISRVLDVFERVVKANGEKDRRWRIEHSQHINPTDYKRFKQLGVIASVQPYHAIEDARFVEGFIGKERLKGTYAFRSLIDNGITLAFGSDWFVAPPQPLMTIDAAVNRMVDGKVFMPEERITVEEALYAYTAWAAYSGREEVIKGTLTEGKLADLVILDQNLLKIPPEKILETKVLATMIGGKFAYSQLI